MSLSEHIRIAPPTSNGDRTEPLLGSNGGIIYSAGHEYKDWTDLVHSSFTERDYLAYFERDTNSAYPYGLHIS